MHSYILISIPLSPPFVCGGSVCVRARASMCVRLLASIFACNSNVTTTSLDDSPYALEREHFLSESETDGRMERRRTFAASEHSSELNLLIS